MSAAGGIKIQADLKGEALLQAKLALMPDKVRRKAVVKALKPAAAILKKHAKATAPTGATGNYKRSIVQRTLRGQPPAVSVYPTVKIAPHRWWMEHGTKPRARKTIGGRFAYLKNPAPDTLSTGRMRAPHHFSKAWRTVGQRVNQTAVDLMWRVIRTGAAR